MQQPRISSIPGVICNRKLLQTAHNIGDCLARSLAVIFADIQPPGASCVHNLYTVSQKSDISSFLVLSGSIICSCAGVLSLGK